MVPCRTQPTRSYPYKHSSFGFHLLNLSSLVSIRQVGHIDKVIMGLDKNNNTPCGFCFVIYYTREESERCVKYINGTVLDDRIVRVDHDWGFQEGRQWGRGRSGGQVGAAGRNTGPCRPSD